MPTRTRTKRNVRKTSTTKRKTTRRRKLTPAQLRQRRYASNMRGVRKRAKTSRGGRGRIGLRSAAQNLKRKLGMTKTR